MSLQVLCGSQSSLIGSFNTSISSFAKHRGSVLFVPWSVVPVFLMPQSCSRARLSGERQGRREDGMRSATQKTAARGWLNPWSWKVKTPMQRHNRRGEPVGNQEQREWEIRPKRTGISNQGLLILTSQPLKASVGAAMSHPWSASPAVTNQLHCISLWVCFGESMQRWTPGLSMLSMAQVRHNLPWFFF